MIDHLTTCVRYYRCFDVIFSQYLGPAMCKIDLWLGCIYIPRSWRWHLVLGQTGAFFDSSSKQIDHNFMMSVPLPSIHAKAFVRIYQSSMSSKAKGRPSIVGRMGKTRETRQSGDARAILSAQTTPALATSDLQQLHLNLVKPN